MNVSLALALVVVTSVVCGVALWPTPVAAASAVRPAPAVVAPWDSLSGSEGDLGRVVLALLDDSTRARAIVCDRVEPGVMLQRSVPASAVVVGGGIALAELDALPRQLLVRLLEHAAVLLSGCADPARLAARVGSGVSFAWAGERIAGAPFYLRLHGSDFAVEWVAREPGVVRAAWRDFARDAGKPWLCEQVFGASR